MARKTFCDRCGKEIKPKMLFRPNGKSYDVMLECIFKRFGFAQKRWELCYDCAKAVREFMNEPDLTDITCDENYEEMDNRKD